MADGRTRKVVVFGSACVDLLMQPERLPRPGVTVLAPTYQLLPGGKGANQAHACAMRLHRVRLNIQCLSNALAVLGVYGIKVLQLPPHDECRHARHGPCDVAEQALALRRIE